MNPFIYSDDNKRYHTLFYYNKKRYSKRVYKAVIDAGFTCPNIDGTKGTGGCIYCVGGSGYFTQKPSVPILQQLEQQKKLILEKHPGTKINAYFQSYSNTYADLKTIKSRVEPVIFDNDVVGISIATRADCINDEIAEYFVSLTRKKDITVELGLQTVYDSTATLINRCHSFDEFLMGYNILKNAGIRVCVHIINGLPEENREMMLGTAETLGKLHPDAVKIHLLHVIEGTKLADMYINGKYTPMEKQAYVETVAHQLTLLPPETVIERLTGDGVKSETLAPEWSKNKISVLGSIDKYLADNDLWQGKNYK